MVLGQKVDQKLMGNPPCDKRLMRENLVCNLTNALIISCRNAFRKHGIPRRYFKAVVLTYLKKIKKLEQGLRYKHSFAMYVVKVKTILSNISNIEELVVSWWSKHGALVCSSSACCLRKLKNIHSLPQQPNL